MKGEGKRGRVRRREEWMRGNGWEREKGRGEWRGRRRRRGGLDSDCETRASAASSSIGQEG